MSYLPIRLSPGTDLRLALEHAAQTAEEFSAFVVSGIGSLADPKLRLAGAESATSLTGSFEILTLSGTLTSDGAHLHMAVADEQGRVLGGHVGYGNIVRTTAEVLLVRLADGVLARELDSRTGYAELVVRAEPADGRDRDRDA